MFPSIVQKKDRRDSFNNASFSLSGSFLNVVSFLCIILITPLPNMRPVKPLYSISVCRTQNGCTLLKFFLLLNNKNVWPQRKPYTKKVEPHLLPHKPHAASSTEKGSSFLPKEKRSCLWHTIFACVADLLYHTFSEMKRGKFSLDSSKIWGKYSHHMEVVLGRGFVPSALLFCKKLCPGLK